MRKLHLVEHIVNQTVLVTRDRSNNSISIYLNHTSMDVCDVCHTMFLSKHSGRSPVVATAKVSRLIHVITVEKGTTVQESRPHGTGAYATANMV